MRNIEVSFRHKEKENSQTTRVFRHLVAGLTALALFSVTACMDTSTNLATADSDSMARNGEIVLNGGFEEGTGSRSSLPTGWVQNVRKTGGKGKIALDLRKAHTGSASLKLVPNSRNDKKFPLAVAQEIPAASLRGKQIEFSGEMAAEGGARALIGLLSVIDGKQGDFAMLFQPSNKGGWVRHSKTYNVPDDPDVKLYLSVWVAGQSGSAWFDDVAISLAGVDALETPRRPVAQDKLEAEVIVNAGDEIRRIPRTLFGANIEWRWNATNFWQEDRQRIDPKGLQLTKEMGLSLIRYPGGIYSDFYHWRDGIGPYEKRPIVKHEAGKEDRSRANFGTDEALAFARDVGAELLITVNAGSGTAQEAADWVRYVNADELRVRYWEIGNELYINSGSPVSKAVTVGPKTYAKRVREFAKAMKEADPRIKIGVIGGLNQGSYHQMDYKNWNTIVFERAGEYVDFLAVHNAYAPILTGDEKNKNPRAVYRAMLARPIHIAENLRRTADQLERFYPDPAKRPFIAVTEWGPIFQFFHAGQYVDHPKTLGSALFSASTLKAFIESPETDIANFWMLNDFSVLGWISSANDEFPPNPDWIPTARYFAFQIFSRHFGERLVKTIASGPGFDTGKVGWSDAAKNVPYLDVVSSLSDDGSKLYIIAINKHFDKEIEATIELKDFVPKGSATRWLLSGSGVDANTGSKVIKVPNLKWGKQVSDRKHRRFTQGGPKEVQLTSDRVNGLSARFTHSFPKHSVTSLVLVRQ